MPTYEYECLECGHRFEVFQKMTDVPVSACEKCSAKVRKILFPVGIMFKGSGFHVNDYGKSDNKKSEAAAE
jgi:putative FmdB family regulatory protein